LRSLLGKREWRIECMDLNIRLWGQLGCLDLLAREAYNDEKSRLRGWASTAWYGVHTWIRRRRRAIYQGPLCAYIRCVNFEVIQLVLRTWATILLV
jgi:hypothetical protein